MALAQLTFLRRNENGFIFKIDSGTNLYYQYKIGETQRTTNGLKILDNIRFTSPLFQVKRAPEQILRTDFLITVPAQLINRETRFIQLYTYKDFKGKSPAISDVQRIMASSNYKPISELTSGLIQLSLENDNMENTYVENKPLVYKEPSLSSGMFWGKIISALPQILKIAAPVVQGLIGGKGTPATAGTTPPTNGDGGGGGGGEKILETIIGILQGLNNKQASPEAQSLSAYQQGLSLTPAILTKLAPLLEKVISPESAHIIFDNPQRFLKTIADAIGKMEAGVTGLKAGNPARLNSILKSVNSENKLEKNKAETKLAEAKIAPALLAALPALAPLLEKVLDPKTIAAVLDSPGKLLKTIGDVAGKLNQQELTHLENINPGVDDPNLMGILNSLSLDVFQDKGIPFRYEPRIELDFVQVSTTMVQGRKKALYSKEKPAYFPIQIKSSHPKAPNRPFDKVIIQLLIQDGESMVTLLQKRFQLKNIKLGDVIQDISLSTHELQGLPSNTDLKTEISFIWKSKRTGKNVGTFKNHFITLVESQVMDRLGAIKGAPVVLNDPIAHRSIWHKVWEGGFTKSNRWNIEFDLKYFYALATDEAHPGRMETKKHIIEDNAEGENEAPYRRQVRAKLKSGMEHTLELLNSLMPALGLAPNTKLQLNALRSEELQESFSQVARVAMEFKGKSGETATLWAYPEIVAQDIIMKKVESINSLGQVTSFNESTITIPRATSVHFTGTISRS